MHPRIRKPSACIATVYKPNEHVRRLAITHHQLGSHVTKECIRGPGRYDISRRPSTEPSPHTVAWHNEPGETQVLGLPTMRQTLRQFQFDEVRDLHSQVKLIDCDTRLQGSKHGPGTYGVAEAKRFEEYHFRYVEMDGPRMSPENKCVVCSCPMPSPQLFASNEGFGHPCRARASTWGLDCRRHWRCGSRYYLSFATCLMCDATRSASPPPSWAQCTHKDATTQSPRRRDLI